MITNSFNIEVYDCDRCKFKFKRSQLKTQKGLLVCPDCYDDISKIKNVDMHLANSPRDNSDTTTEVESPTVFEITTAGGITAQNSMDTDTSRGVTLETSLSVSFGSSYFMKIVSDGGAIDLTADPQITAGTKGDILTIQGTSNTDSVLLEDGTGVELYGGISFVIGHNDVITLVYDSTKSKWVETSRQKNGGF